MRIATRILPFLLAIVFALPAHAEKGKLHFERADVSKYPVLKLYLTLVENDGRVITGKGKEDFKLVFDSNEQGTATDVKTFDQAGEPVYLVAVAQVNTAMQDVFDDVKKGISTLARSAGQVKGSKVAVLAYAQDVKRLVEMSKPSAVDEPLGKLAVATEGTETHLLDAVRTAIDLLNAKGVPDKARKLIVVFSDGIDVSGSGKRDYAELGKRALAAGIVVDTIGYNAFDPSRLRSLYELAKQTNGTDRTCKSPQDVSQQFANTADELVKQYVVQFRSSIAGDGKEHTIQVVNDSASGPIYSQAIASVCEMHQEETVRVPFWRRWWFWTFFVVLPLLIAIVLVVRSRAGRPRPEPEAVPEAPEAAPEAGPQRTIALDVSSLGKGTAIGWIVGMTGKYNERTFKLRPATTLIGSAPESDIQIQDGRVSRKHCEIRFDGTGYRIVDLGSTNGVILNDKRVPQGELIDGDLFRLGDTEFKFKSIN